MNYALIVYTLFALGIALGGTSMLNQGERTYSAFMFLVASIVIFTYYGIRWFGDSDALKTSPYTSKSWPPVINMCPDFLTLYQRQVGNQNEAVCVDMVGVSSGISKFTQAENAFNDQYIFQLFPNLTGDARIKALCEQCASKKLTWEGVYDGTSCIVSSGGVPNPKGGADTRSAGPGVSCTRNGAPVESYSLF